MTALPPGISAMQVLKEKHEEITRMNLNLNINPNSAINNISNIMEKYLSNVNDKIPEKPTTPASLPNKAPSTTTVVQQQPPLPKKTYKRMPKNTVSNS